MPRNETSGMAVVIYGDKILTISELVFGRVVLSLPKGHQENDESIIDTAIRECFEETNIQLNNGQLICELTQYTYDFTLPDGTLIKKTIYPFLFKTDHPGEPCPKEKNMISVDWMNLQEFFQKCTYDSVKAVVTEALTK